MVKRRFSPDWLARRNSMQANHSLSHRTAVPDDTLKRKIMIVEDAPSISNILEALPGWLGHDGQVEFSGEPALANTESINAVMLDLRYSIPPTDHVPAKMSVQPSLVGGVLVITGEVAGPADLEWIERLCRIHTPHQRLKENVRHWLRTLWGPSAQA